MASITDYMASRGLSFEAVAEKSHLSVDRLRAIVVDNDASLKEMRSIAGALRVPVNAFLDSPPEVEPVNVLFRQSAKSRERREASSFDVTSNQLAQAFDLVRTCPKNTGWLDLFRDVEMNFNSAERVAMLFRKAYGNLDDLEPFQNLSHVIGEELGVHVLYSKDSSIDGASAIIEGHAFILISGRTFRPRMLFTLAHELGHLIAHHDAKETGYALVDAFGEAEGIKGSQKSEEVFADTFASALVLPRHGVLRGLQSIRNQLRATGPLGDVEILALARIFGVGFEVAALRCEQLELLPRDGARGLYNFIKENHTNPERRADNIGLPPREDMHFNTSSGIINAGVENIRSGQMSIGRVAEILNLPLSSLIVANAESIG